MLLENLVFKASMPCRIYFNPIGGRPGIISPHGIDVSADEFPSDWFEGLADDMYKARRYVNDRNKYKVRAVIMQHAVD